MDFVLEKWQTGYLDDFIKSTNDPHLSDNLCENLPYPMDVAFAAEYIRGRMLNNEQHQVCRAIVVDGRIAGGIDVLMGSGLFSKSAEISVWIAKDYRGQGLGTDVIKHMCRFVFENYDVIRIEGHPYSSHKPAIAALKKSGFIHEGTVHSAIFKGGSTYDYEIYAMINDPTR